MKKILLRALVIAVLVVNLLGWLVGVYSEVEIGALFRIALIVGILFITAIFAGFAADALLQSESMKYAAVGAVSYTAPEVLSFLVKFVNRKGKQLTK